MVATLRPPRLGETERHLSMPAFGVIHGCRLDGWRFHFLRFVVETDPDEDIGTDDLRVLARCTPPRWPFPCDIRLMTWRDYIELRAVPGERAKRFDAYPLIVTAYRFAEREPPAWLADFKPSRTAPRINQP